MTPQDFALVRRIARAAAERASGGGVPSVWTGEVQVYNEALAEQGIRTLRGLAAVVSDLQVASADASDEAPRGNERAFGFEGGRLVSIQHGTKLGSDAAALVRHTALRYDEDGRLESVHDLWEHDGALWGRETVLSYDDAGAVALVVRSATGPLEFFLHPMPVQEVQ